VFKLKILGIASFYNNASSSLLVDGKVIAAAEEERFNRIKQGKKYNFPISLTDLPFNSISYCLEEGGISIDDVDIVAYGFDPAKKISACLNDKETLQDDGQAFFVNLFNYAIPSLEQPRISYYLKKRLNGKKEPAIEFIDHHVSHAASSYLLSGFAESLVFVNDGSGEEDCISTFIANDNEMIKLFSVPRKHFQESIR